MTKRTMSKPAMMAKEIRKELKELFPMTKFSVRSKSYSGGGSVSIKWTDFPMAESVKKVTSKYEQVHKCEVTGETLLGANYFVFERQEISDELREKAKKRLPDDMDDNPLTYNYWLDKALGELYEEVKGFYEGDHHLKSKELGKKSKAPKTQIKEENKEKPATRKQLWALHCITKMDTRKWNLTRSEASNLIKKSNSNIDITRDIDSFVLNH